MTFSGHCGMTNEASNRIEILHNGEMERNIKGINNNMKSYKTILKLPPTLCQSISPVKIDIATYLSKGSLLLPHFGD